MKQVSILLALGFGIALTGCAAKHEQKLMVPVKPIPPVALVEHYQIPDVAQLFSLLPEQKAQFHHYFYAEQHQHIAAHERLYNYLLKFTAGFDYQGKNLTASEALKLKQGNCITLAVLTKALADSVGLKTSFQQVVSAPVFGIEGNWFISSDHVRTFVYDDTLKKRATNVITPASYIVVDYFPASGDIIGERISSEHFYAMFYRNLGADALLDEEYPLALAYLTKAVEIAPDYAAAINLVALVHAKMQQDGLARLWYEYGLDIAGDTPVLLSNYAILQQRTGEHEAARRLQDRLQQLSDPDPFALYQLARDAHRKQEYIKAVRLYQRLIDRAPYVANFYFEMARSYYGMRQFAFARDALQQAAKLSKAGAEETRYHAKLEALQRNEAL